MVQTKFSLNHAKARLLPTAAQIVVATTSTQQTFLRVLADVRFTAGLSQAEEAREERLNSVFWKVWPWYTKFVCPTAIGIVFIHSLNLF